MPVRCDSASSVSGPMAFSRSSGAIERFEPVSNPGMRNLALAGFLKFLDQFTKPAA